MYSPSITIFSRFGLLLQVSNDARLLPDLNISVNPVFLKSFDVFAMYSSIAIETRRKLLRMRLFDFCVFFHILCKKT